ncbi:hypothetical protein [Flavobacterium sp. JP2137]|uniref:hypothetical protein n=1 Tax=Flavobacterium sp. JP2137 TaxID=3414510 RepID=UPI003D2FE2E5
MNKMRTVLLCSVLLWGCKQNALLSPNVEGKEINSFARPVAKVEALQSEFAAVVAELPPLQFENEEEFEAILQHYELFVHHFMGLYHQVQNGELKALSEYTQLMPQAALLQQRLAGAVQSSKFTKAQWNSLHRLEQKISELLH